MKEIPSSTKVFFVVWRRHTGSVIRTHQTYDEAYAEAYRLTLKEGGHFLRPQGGNAAIDQESNTTDQSGTPRPRW